MKTVLALAVMLAVCAPAVHAQEAQPALGSMRLLNASPSQPTPTETPVAAPPVATPISAPAIAAPVDVAPEAAAPVAAGVTPPTRPAVAVATGWTGPVNFSPVAIVDLISRVCRPAVSGEGGDVPTQAVSLGLGGPQQPVEGLARALPKGAVTWQVPSVDGVLFMFGYGEAPLSCGAAVVRPLAEDGFNKVLDILQAPAMGFVSESSQILQGDVRWARLKSPKGEFIDLMEYPMQGDTPGVLRAEYLPG